MIILTLFSVCPLNSTPPEESLDLSCLPVSVQSNKLLIEY